MAAAGDESAPSAETDFPGRLFPVCCAAIISPEVSSPARSSNSRAECIYYQIQDSFFYAVTDHDPMANDIFVIVDSLTKSYTEEMEPGDNEPTSGSSPFIGKTPYECAQLLKQLRRDTDSDIDFTSFIIMDDRTLQDSTILIVEQPGEADGGASNSVRATFELASNLLVYLSGKSSAYEERELAETTEDGVLRPGMHH